MVLFADSFVGLLAWPAVVLILGLVGMFAFRAQVASFLDRVKKVDKEGVSTETPPQPQRLDQQSEVTKGPEVQALMQTFDSPALLAQERRIVASLEANKLDASSDTSKVLIRHLAKFQIAITCEFIYRYIFGSQITFLKRLNTFSFVPAADAESYYGTVSALYPQAFPAENKERYFYFLTTHNLAAVGEEQQYIITDFGREFLAWMVQSGVSENKDL